MLQIDDFVIHALGDVGIVKHVRSDGQIAIKWFDGETFYYDARELAAYKIVKLTRENLKV